MSVLIKGMRMPSNCVACDLEEFDDCGNGYRCPLIYKGYTAKIRQDGKLPKCPLVELPEKHGRLIDADKLIDYCNDMLRIISESDDDMINIITSRICYAGVIGQIINMATIFEAEGE